MRDTKASHAGLLSFLAICLLSTITASAAAQAHHWWMCRYPDLKDPAKPALGSVMYYALIPASGDDSKLNAHFNGYIQQNYKVTDNGNSGMGFCQRYSDDAATRTNSMDMMLKQWASSKISAINVKWTDTPAEDAAIDAKLAAGHAAPSAAAASAAGSKECAYHGTCAPAPTAGSKTPPR